MILLYASVPIHKSLHEGLEIAKIVEKGSTSKKRSKNTRIIYRELGIMQTPPLCPTESYVV